ncbi:hypothetical protein [Thermomonospora umbrina]|uniref:Fibronectin type-III domain-containing protein n=1 Tax=Thermomonospora umbrina TaxID=111806 RepID=A0A3D9T038_9ACTN|nr:hypothetical protein [Thermomonospora umbrina]REE97201.1 hypothetical protein DFJ69_2663 [Thermomonospora umbrina]
MTLDKAAYERAVLAPAADAGGTPPADLLVRYGLAGARRPGEAAFAAHLAEVERLWRAAGVRSRRFRPLTDALLAAHAELAETGRLTWDHFVAIHGEHEQKAKKWVGAQIRALAEAVPCVSAAMARRLADRSDGVLTESQVRDQLVAAGLQIVDSLWRIPDAPAGGRGLRDALRTLGLDLSADVVFGKDERQRGFHLRGGFRLDSGESLTAETIDRRRRVSSGRSYSDARKVASDTVLTVLEKSARENALEDLLLWEAAELLRGSVEDRAPLPLVIGEAVTLGLAEAEAQLLALSLLEQRGPLSQGGGAAVDAEAALADGRLREAERLRGSLGDEHVELAARIDRASAEVADVIADAMRELASGRTEEAAALLDEALRRAVDDDALPGRLAAIPPPPATEVRAGADGGVVAVSWTPAIVRAGRIAYRVVRTAGRPATAASAGHAVAETGGNDARDPAPPAATDLYYTVFGRRDEGTWSPPSAGAVVRCLPEVTDVRLTADEHTVRGTWTVHRDAAEVEVVRLDDDRRIAAAREGFTDTDVTPGTIYRYRIRVVYRPPAGGRETTRGIEAEMAPETAPREVADLSVAAEGRDGARIVWTAVEGGKVVIRTGHVAPPWTPGDPMTVAEAERYGTEVTGTPVPLDDGRFAMTVPLDGADRRYFAAVTVGGGEAIGGPYASIRAVAPVRELTVRRFGGRVRLSWIWPDGAVSAMVRWVPRGRPAAPPVELGRQAYLDNGGYDLDAGSSAGRVEVRAVTRDAEGVVEAPSVRASIPAAGQKVTYEFRRRRRLFGRDRAVLRLTVEADTLVPPLDVVHGTGHTRPLRRDQGEIVHSTPSQRITPSVPCEVEFDVPSGRRSWLVCFGPDDGSVILNRLRGNW